MRSQAAWETALYLLEQLHAHFARDPNREQVEALFGAHAMADPHAYLSAVSALVWTFVGGITSIATSWLGRQRQTKE